MLVWILDSAPLKTVLKPVKGKKMKDYSRRLRGFAAALAALAGYVDAIGFLSMGGYFVSFMSGNSTRLGVGIAAGSAQVYFPALLILTFVIGVVLGDAVGHRNPARRHRFVLSLVALLLAIAAAFSQTDFLLAAVLPAALAMGAANTVFVRSEGLPVGLTYMTGTLVQLGHRIGARLRGEESGRSRGYLLHWLALVSGGVLGATAHRYLGLKGLWIAAALAALLALLSNQALRASLRREESITPNS